MASLILKLLTDGFWYLSVITPVIGAVPLAARAGFPVLFCLYGIRLLMNRGKRDFMGNAQDVFLFEVKALVFVSVFQLVILGASRWQVLCAPFVIAFLVSGIFLMRIGRVSEEEQRQAKFWALNGMCLLPVLAAALLLSSKTVFGGARLLLGEAYNRLILPVLLGILRLFVIVLQALAPLLSGLFPQLTNLSTEMGMVVLDTDTGLDLEGGGVIETPFFAKVLGVALAVGVIGFLLFLIYRRIAKSDLYEEDRYTARTRQSGIQTEEKPDNSGGFFGREKNVRYYYRKFLRLCRENGLEPEDCMTSQEIQRQAGRFWPGEDLEVFHDLYRRVRYGGGEEQKEERRQAKEIYKKLKDSRFR